MRYIGGRNDYPSCQRWSRYHRHTAREAHEIVARYGYVDTDEFTLGDRRLSRYIARSAPTGLAPKVARPMLAVAPPADRMVGTGYRCHYCGQAATTIDHVWPKSRGGDDHPNNLVRACAACNSSKGTRSLFGQRCPDCREVRHPGDLDTATQVAYYACRCGRSWSATVALQEARLPR